MSYNWSALIQAKKHADIENLIKNQPQLINEPNDDDDKYSLLMLILENKREFHLKLVESIMNTKGFNLNYKNDLDETNAQALLNSPIEVITHVMTQLPKFKEPLLAVAKAELASAVRLNQAASQSRRDHLSSIITTFSTELPKAHTQVSVPKPTESKKDNALPSPATNPNALLKPPAPPRKNKDNSDQSNLAPTPNLSVKPSAPPRTNKTTEAQKEAPLSSSHHAFLLQNEKERLIREHQERQSKLVTDHYKKKAELFNEACSILTGRPS